MSGRRLRICVGWRPGCGSSEKSASSGFMRAPDMASRYALMPATTTMPRRKASTRPGVFWRRTSAESESLARHGPNEALHLGLVVVVVQAGADERVDSARGQIDPRQAGLVGVDAHGAQPIARLARRLAVLEKGDDPALLHSSTVHAHAGSLRELPPQQRREPVDPRFDRLDPHTHRVAGGDAQADLAGD